MITVLQVLFSRRLFRAERIFRARTNTLDMYTDVEMIKYYRFRRDNVLERMDRESPIKEILIKLSMLISVSTQVHY